MAELKQIIISFMAHALQKNKKQRNLSEIEKNFKASLSKLWYTKIEVFILEKGVIEMKRRIRVRNTNDIQKINQIVCRYPYDIWIHSKSGMVDAKSFLGMFAFTLNETKYLVVDDNVDATGLFKELSEFLDYEEEE